MKLHDTFDLLQQFERCANANEVTSIVLGATKNLGVENYFAGSMPVIGTAPEAQLQHVIGGLWPDDWTARYFRMGYLDHDPTIEHVRRSNNALIWKDVIQSTKNSQLVMNEARQFGLVNGVTVSQCSLDGFKIGISFAGQHMETENPAMATILTVVSTYAVASLLRVQINDFKDAPVNLSDREREVLYWVAEGKTGSEAAMIMNLATATVEKHFRSVLLKLGTQNRAHATAEAIRRGIIR